MELIFVHIFIAHTYSQSGSLSTRGKSIPSYTQAHRLRLKLPLLFKVVNTNLNTRRIASAASSPYQFCGVLEFSAPDDQACAISIAFLSRSERDSPPQTKTLSHYLGRSVICVIFIRTKL